MRWTDLKECCDYYNINYKYSSHFNVLLEQVKKLYFPFGDEKFASSFPVTILVKADAIVL